MVRHVSNKSWFETAEEYKKAVAVYKTQNPTEIYKVFRFLKGTNRINYVYIQKALKEDFPKAEWLGKDNMKEQVIALLTEMGFAFTANENGDIFFTDALEYEQIVNNHLIFTGKDILYRIDHHFTNFGGSKINYKMMGILLGEHFPKAPYIDKRN